MCCSALTHTCAAPISCPPPPRRPVPVTVSVCRSAPCATPPPPPHPWTPLRTASSSSNVSHSPPNHPVDNSSDEKGLRRGSIAAVLNGRCRVEIPLCRAIVEPIVVALCCVHCCFGGNGLITSSVSCIKRPTVSLNIQ